MPEIRGLTKAFDARADPGPGAHAVQDAVPVQDEVTPRDVVPDAVLPPGRVEQPGQEGVADGQGHAIEAVLATGGVGVGARGIAVAGMVAPGLARQDHALDADEH